MAESWDDRYAAAEGGLFGETPNEYLRMIFARGDFAARSALMLADGDGRNGAWVAAQGLATAAVDLSAVATARAEARDRLLGVRVARAVGDLAAWAPPDGARYDVASVLFLHGPAALRERALRLGAEALAPGGWLIVEGFSRDREGAVAMGPEDPDKRYAKADLAAAALRAGLEIVELFEGLARLDEGERHEGLAAVARLAARRPR